MAYLFFFIMYWYLRKHQKPSRGGMLPRVVEAKMWLKGIKKAN